MSDPRKHWRKLAAVAAAENDKGKLLALIEEMADALDEVSPRQSDAIFQQVHGAERIGKRMLFVDDEPSIRATLPAILQQRGFQVRIAASVADALAALKEQTFDVLVSDLNIGEEGDGFKVVRAIRQANALSVTILLTGYPAFDSAIQAIHDEVDDYFVKPAEIESLVTTIERKLLSRAALEAVRRDAR